jgi:aminoglycoside phosphotransferase (APT) family kinase protein
VHGDIGFHNLAFDPGTLAVRGLFDFKDAAWADRHVDFRYLMFDIGRFDLLDAACDAYSKVTGYQIDRNRVVLYNAVWAISFLAFRAGTSPSALYCGRTLAGDLGWSRAALALALGSADGQTVAG